MRTKYSAAVLGLAVLFTSPVFAQVSKTVMTATIASCFPDNTTGSITPAGVRSCLNALINSYQQYLGINIQTATTYTIQLSDYGQLIIFNSAASVAVTLPQGSGTFATFNTRVTNINTGAVTITPTGSTIGGAATLVLAKNQTAQIISNGTNYAAQMELPFFQ